REKLDVGNPRLRPMKMAFDRKFLPQLQLAFDILARGFRLQPQRMAGEIYPLITIRSARSVEAIAVGRERILAVQVPREIFCCFESSRFEPARCHPSLLRSQNDTTGDTHPCSRRNER